MSHIVLMAMKKQWISFILIMFLVHTSQLQMGSQGLSCVNDFVNTVSCTWNSSAVAPGVDCWIEGVKKIYGRNKRQIHQSCKLKQQRASPPGCSFSFNNSEFDFFEKLPNISVKCNGIVLEVLTEYQPCDHVKLNPPDVPIVNSTANETWIFWSAGRPQSALIKNFDFELQIKLQEKTWKEAITLTKSEQHQIITGKHWKQYNQARVRVRPTRHCKNHWSDWSPTASWREDGPSLDEEWSPDHTWLVTQAMMLSALLFVVMLVLYMSCLCKWRPVVKPLPNPSKYFPTLHSVHGGNLKKWLNPLSASESFFTAQPHDHISRVEVCETWDMIPSTSPSPSSTSANLLFRSFPSAGSGSSGVVDNSSSSCFSNMGYFMSDASSSLAGPDPTPAYFSYQDDVHNLRNNHNVSLSLCPSFIASRAYESLKREPQSPDSGLGIRQEDEEGKRDEMDMSEKEASDGHQGSPLLILPLHLSSWVSPPSPAPASPHPPSLIQICSDIQEVDDEPEAAACESYAAWPVAGSMCRSSSMPVEPCKTGYLTLKELQTTFSNKSI